MNKVIVLGFLELCLRQLDPKLVDWQAQNQDTRKLANQRLFSLYSAWASSG